MKTIAVLPARYGSTRFPGKPLAKIAGKVMIQRVYECAMQAKLIDEVIVATDDQRILDAVEEFGGRVVMTRSDHATGTDRIAEAVAGIDADLVVNIQGDEPLMPAAVLDRLVQGMIDSGAEMGTVASPFASSGRDVQDANAVKVVLNKAGFALYFSRAAIPFCRQGGTAVEPLLHWGLYAYKKSFLNEFITWEQSNLEQCEMLEQLRVLENGARIWVAIADEVTIGVDTPEDIARVEAVLADRE